jgi:2-iminobutanoate/2-iminopropanoate deaminase
MGAVDWPAGGHYSLSVVAGDTVYVAGQTAGIPGSDELAAMDVREQTARCIERIGVLVGEAGGSLESVVKTTCFLADIGDFAVFNATYAEAFGSHAPARSTIQVGRFPAGLLVEIEAIAVIAP